MTSLCFILNFSSEYSIKKSANSEYNVSDLNHEILSRYKDGT